MENYNSCTSRNHIDNYGEPLQIKENYLTENYQCNPGTTMCNKYAYSTLKDIEDQIVNETNMVKIFERRMQKYTNEHPTLKHLEERHKVLTDIVNNTPKEKQTLKLLIKKSFVETLIEDKKKNINEIANLRESYKNYSQCKKVLGMMIKVIIQAIIKFGLMKMCKNTEEEVAVDAELDTEEEGAGLGPEDPVADTVVVATDTTTVILCKKIAQAEAEGIDLVGNNAENWLTEKLTDIFLSNNTPKYPGICKPFPNHPPVD